jgi:hypothetical protein
MPDVIGSFVFRNEGDGCLTGKYINRGMISPLTESSKIQGQMSNDRFSGRYFTVWLDTATFPGSSFLDITRNNESYDLIWTLSDSRRIYAGQGMLFGDLLLGSYWSYDLDDILPTD